MSRPLRIEFKNAWYHVMNRGACAQNIFLCNKHRKIFLSLLEDITEIYSIEIHAYCLMGNHYHLLIKTPLANLSRAIRHLNSTYTQRFNKIEGRDGSLFRGRYKSIVVSGFKYLLDVSRYIHLNPVKANIVKKPEGYYWSSYKNYITQNNNKWLYTEKLLSYFKKPNCHLKYETFVHEGIIQNDLDKLYQDIKLPVILGNEQSKIILERMVKQSLYSNEISSVNEIRDRYSLDNLYFLIAHYYNLDTVKLKHKYRREMIFYQRIFMYIARYVCKYTLKEITVFFGNTTYSNISYATTHIKNALRKNRQLQKDVMKITSIISQSVQI
ncbi:MAG: transposase [Gammaproteobacteria bacterium]